MYRCGQSTPLVLWNILYFLTNSLSLLCQSRNEAFDDFSLDLYLNYCQLVSAHFSSGLLLSTFYIKGCRNCFFAIKNIFIEITKSAPGTRVHAVGMMNTKYGRTTRGDCFTARSERNWRTWNPWSHAVALTQAYNNTGTPVHISYRCPPTQTIFVSYIVFYSKTFFEEP